MVHQCSQNTSEHRAGRYADQDVKVCNERPWLRRQPYQQNIPESSNDMLKDWSNFVPQDMDKFIVSLYDFVESFHQEEELAWFQLSDKW